MTLDSYLTEHKISGEEFGRRIGLTGMAVRRYCRGERMPEADTIEKIRAATDGAVTVTDLHETRLAYLADNPVTGSPRPEDSTQAA